MSSGISPEPVPPGNLADSAPASRSLAPRATETPLDTARWIIIGAGILWIGINGILFAQIGQDVESLIQSKVDEIHNLQREPDPQSVIDYRTVLLRHHYVVIGGSAALGVALIVLGALVKSFPVPCTLLGLAGCLCATAACAAVAYRSGTPEMPWWNWLWKILTIAALIKAVHSAMASPRIKKPSKRGAIIVPR